MFAHGSMDGCSSASDYINPPAHGRWPRSRRQRQRATLQHRYFRPRISCRLCINATMCNMRNNGTRNAGISSSGSIAIGGGADLAGSPGREQGADGSNADGGDEVQYPKHIPTDECATGRETGPTQQAKNHPRGRDADGHVSEAGWQGEHSRKHLVRIEGEKAHTGPAPGLHSRNDSKIQREYELAEVERESRSHAKKSSRGAATPIAMGTGGVPGRPTKAPAAPSDTTSSSQTVSTSATARRILPCPPACDWSAWGRDYRGHDILLFVTCILQV